jgi:CRP-like cAMP-binding protein
MAGSHVNGDGVEAAICATCPTRHCAEWRVVGDVDMARVDREKTARRYRPSETVFAQGEPVSDLYCIADGLLVLRTGRPAGRPVAVRLAHAGQTAGGRDVLAGEHFTLSAVALVPSLICRVPRDTVHDVLAAAPAFGERMQQTIAADGQKTEDALARLAGSALQQRLAHLLLELLPRFGRTGPAGAVELTLPIHWRELAALVWSRPETVSRALHGLMRSGCLTLRGSTVTIPDVSRLREETVRL